MKRVPLSLGEGVAPLGPASRPVLALGNFDGVHLGHQEVLAHARSRALGLGAPLAAAVFEPHPRQVLRPDGPPFRLQNAAQRARALWACDVETVYELHFNDAFHLLTDR